MTMATMTFRAAKHRNVLYGLVGVSLIMSVFLVSQTHSRLKKAEDETVKCQQKHDSVAAQFTVLFESKARLEKSLNAEIERKKLIEDEMKTLKGEMSKDKMILNEKNSKLQREFEDYKSHQNEEFSKLKATYESLRSDKEKLDGDVDDLNIQNQKLKDANQKLEEEIRKMQQSQPIDMDEVAHMKERLLACDAAQVPSEDTAAKASSLQKVADGEGVSDGNGPVGDKQHETSTLKANAEAITSAQEVPQVLSETEIKKQQDTLGVLPPPQQQAKVSSSRRPVAQAPAAPEEQAVGAQPAPQDLQDHPVDTLQNDASQKRSYLGHHFGDNIDQNKAPIFHKVGEAQGEERDYPANPDKDDDGGADDGEDGGEKGVNRGGGGLDKENNLNPEENANFNDDFDDTNGNANDVQGVRVLPK